MRKAATEYARKHLSELINQVKAGDRVTISRHGKPIAALVRLDDLALLERVEDRIDGEAAKKVLRTEEKRISLKEAKRQLGLTSAQLVAITRPCVVCGEPCQITVPKLRPHTLRAVYCARCVPCTTGACGRCSACRKRAEEA